MAPNGNWEKEFKALNRKIDRLSATNEKLVSQVGSLSSQLSESNTQNKVQAQAIDKLSRTVDELKQVIAARDARIAVLEEQKNKNSGNSSKPSSTDFFNKPKPSSINKGESSATKKKSGGQQGHTGSTMKLKEIPDIVQSCLPLDCIGCQLSSTCESRIAESRHVVDVRIVNEQSRYDRIERTCPKTGTVISGSFPSGVNAPQQYGSNLKALVVSLSSFGMVSASRISEILGGVAGISISDGTVCNIIADCANRCEAFIPELKEHVIASYVSHFDETGVRVNGKVQWAHTSSTEKVTLISTHPKRGVAGILAAGVLDRFPGLAVSDCWGSYFCKDFEGVTHATCGAHIDCELEGIIQNTKQRWARSMQNLLGEMYRAKSSLMSQGISRAPDDLVESCCARFDQILDRGFSRNPDTKPEAGKRGKRRKGKARNLLERLQKLKDAVLRFFTNFRVPFSNNIAERSYRLSKLKQKVVGSLYGTV